jgi:addiction module HigA family antidote
MRMKDPSHPGAIIKGNLEALHLSVEEAAKRMEVDPQQLRNIVNEKSPITLEIAPRFARIFKHDHAALYLRIQANYDRAHPPKKRKRTLAQFLMLQAR